MPSQVTRRGFLGSTGVAAVLGTGAAMGNTPSQDPVQVRENCRHLLQPAEG